MSKFDKALKLMGKVAEEAAPAVEQQAMRIPKQYAHLFETPEQYAEWVAKNKRYDLEDKVKALGQQPASQAPPPAALPPESGPATMSGNNKLFNPELSGKVDYKKAKGIAAMSPMGAAEDLYKELQASPVGDLATKWNKIKSMVGDKLAGQLDLSGGKDPEFQKQASGVLSTALDPVNLVPGVGGIAAGAAEMLARDEEDEKKKQPKKP